MADKLTGKALGEKIEGITQRGEPVPGGYTFNPRHDPPLYPTGKGEVVNRPRNDAPEGKSDGDGAAGKE